MFSLPRLNQRLSNFVANDIVQYIPMTSTIRTTFQDELVKLHNLVLDLANKVSANGELLLKALQDKDRVHDYFLKIKSTDKEVNAARWQVHDFGDQLIVLQQPVAKDFRQIITSVQVTDNLERIGDHFKKAARFLEKADLKETEIPEEIIEMAKLGLKMLNQAINAYSEIFQGKTNEIASIDDAVDTLYKQAIKTVVKLLKQASEEKIDGYSQLFFIARCFERSADHSAKVGELVNFAITGKRNIS